MQAEDRRLAPAARGGIPVEMRIPASERTSQKLNELLTQGIAEGDARSELIKLAVRKIVEEALEAEVAEGGGARVLRERRGAGRRLSQWVPAEPPAHGGERDRVRRASGRRSYRAVRVAGARGFDRPDGRARTTRRRDVRPRAECARYRSGLPRCARRECAEPHCRQPGDRAAVAGVRSLRRPRPQRIRHRLLLRRWRRRASARRAAPRGGALRLGITEDGRKVLLHLAPGTKEDTASCTAFFEDLKRRGLADPLLAVTDGAPSLIRAVATCFPRALRQRCLVHRMRNLRSKAPESQWPEIALRARGCYEAASPALAASSATTSSPPTSGSCRRWCSAFATTSRRASRISASRSGTAA